MATPEQLVESEPLDSEPPAQPGPLELLLIDSSLLDRTCFMAGLATDPSIRVVACADADSVEPAAFSRGRPDVIILRVVAEERSEIEVDQWLSTLAKTFSATATMLIVPTTDPSHVLTALRHEVEGLTSDQLSIASTIDVMRLVHTGMLVYPRSLFGLLQQRSGSASVGTSKQARLRTDKLTARQYEVLQLIANGLPNRTIARRLRISESTVKVHVRAIMERLGIVNRTQAAARFRDSVAESRDDENIPSSRR